MSDSIRIVYAGTPDFAVPALSALIASEHEVVAVYTQPDRPAGRGREPRPSAVKQKALEHNVPVFQPESLGSESDQSVLRELSADLMVVAAYGLLLPKAVLDIPAPRLHQYPCLAAAALARCCTHSACHTGWRHPYRHHHHANG